MRTLVAAFLFSTSMWAGTIFDNGGPITDPNLACGPSCPELTTSIGLGAFDLLPGSMIAQVEFWTFQLPGAYNDGMLNWQIDADISGSPGTMMGSGTFGLSSNQVKTDVFVAGFGPMTEYATTFTTPSLSAIPLSGQNYFLKISDTSGADRLGIFWATSGPGTLAFQIDGINSDAPTNNVPEPGTAVLFASGVFCILACRNWLRKRISV
jgi:hypothetical protein